MYATHTGLTPANNTPVFFVFDESQQSVQKLILAPRTVEEDTVLTGALAHKLARWIFVHKPTIASLVCVDVCGQLLSLGEDVGATQYQYSLAPLVVLCALCSVYGPLA